MKTYLLILILERKEAGAAVSDIHEKYSTEVLMIFLRDSTEALKYVIDMNIKIQ